MKNEATIDGITVGGQPTAEELTSGRFGTVINVRRHEEAGNDSAAILADGTIGYTAVPYTADTITKDDIVRVRKAVDEAGGPVLIH